MAHCPDFSDTDSNFSDDPEYEDFKQRSRQLNRIPYINQQNFSEEDKKQQQLNSLFSALSSGNVKVITEMLDSGLSININIQDNWTPISLAVSFGNPELTEELIKRGADVNSRRDGCTALMMACNCPKTTSPFGKSLAVIKLLVENGANVKAINRKRMTAIMFAANNGNLDAVKYLLPLSDKNAEDNQRWTALFWAVNSNEIETVKYLLQEGFEYSACDVRNNTPIDIARNNDFHEIVNLFPKEDLDLSTIIDSKLCTFEETFANLRPGEKPKFFLDIYNILCGVKSEAAIKLIADKDVGLYEFLSMSDEDLKNLGVALPFQRKRILGGLHRFHKQPYHPKSLHVVPLNESYSNIDIATQLLSTTKQVIAMEAGIAYVMKNYNPEDITKSESESMTKSVDSIKKNIKLCQIVLKKLRNKAVMLDAQVKPVDLITVKSWKYKVPWRKILFSVSVISLIILYRKWK